MKTKARKIENVTTTQHQEDSFYLQWQMGDGLRYHIWINGDGTPQTGLKNWHSGARGTIIYCNPPLSAKRGEPGHFDTRKLNADAACNRPIVAEVLSRLDLAGARAAWDANKAREREENARQETIRLQEKAGPALFAACQSAEELAQEIKGHCYDKQDCDRIRALAIELLPTLTAALALALAQPAE